MTAPENVPPNIDFIANIDIASIQNLGAVTNDAVLEPVVFRLDDVATGNINGLAIP